MDILCTNAPRLGQNCLLSTRLLLRPSLGLLGMLTFQLSTTISRVLLALTNTSISFLFLCSCAAAIILSSAGAAIGTAKSGVGIAGIGTFKPELIMKVGFS